MNISEKQELLLDRQLENELLKRQKLGLELQVLEQQRTVLELSARQIRLATEQQRVMVESVMQDTHPLQTVHAGRTLPPQVNVGPATPPAIEPVSDEWTVEREANGMPGD